MREKGRLNSVLNSWRQRFFVALAVVGLVGLYGARRVYYRYRKPPRVEVAPAAEFRVGYNMDFPGDWTNLPPFVDHFKNARSMRGQCAESDPECHPTRHLQLDEQGWVTSLVYRDDPSRAYDRVEIVLNTSEERSDIGEPFVLTWQGEGDLSLWGAQDAVRDTSRKRITFSLPKANLVLRLTSIDPERTGKPLRDIRVFRASQEKELRDGVVFNPEMMRFLAPFRSLRFMDWMVSNEHGRCSGGSHEGEACYAVSNEICESGRCVTPGKWSERPLPDQAIGFSSGQFLDVKRPELGSRVGGYPVETMVALANAADAAPHFNMPANADEEYVRNFARYVRGRLKPSLPVSVEYSNEVWNWDFPQAQYAKVRGEKLFPGRGSAWVEYMAVRTNAMCKVFEEVFEGQRERLRCLISPQTGWRELAQDVLDCPGWVELHPEAESCITHVDALNITGYFAGCLHRHPEVIEGWLAEGREVALTKAFEQLEHGGLIESCEGEDRDSLDFTIETYDFFMQLAARNGLGLEVYEGGTHFEYEDKPAVKELLVLMTKDPRMYAAYRRNIKAVRDTGGSVFNAWGWIAPHDSWANADSLTDLGHPKYRALVDTSRELSTVR